MSSSEINGLIIGGIILLALVVYILLKIFFFKLKDPHEWQQPGDIDELNPEGGLSKTELFIRAQGLGYTGEFDFKEIQEYLINAQSLQAVLEGDKYFLKPANI